MDPTETIARPRRHAADAVVVLLGAALLVVCALPVDRGGVSRPELAALRAINGVTGIPFALAWLPMQLGSLAAVPTVTLAAGLARRWRPAIALGTAGLAAWLGAKAVKQVVPRARPGALVDGVVLRDAPTGGLGFVSGHAAVAAALAAVSWPYLGSRGRAVVVGLAVLVGVLRLYVGAHLPLDILGGAALGLAAGGAAHLVLGRPAGPPALAVPGARGAP